MGSLDLFNLNDGNTYCLYLTFTDGRIVSPKSNIVQFKYVKEPTCTISHRTTQGVVKIEEGESDQFYNERSHLITFTHRNSLNGGKN